MSKRLDGKVALITGASRGIGREACLHLASEGAHVIAVARTQGGLEELDDAIRAVGGQATLVPMDLKDTPAIDRLGAAIFERWKRLDVLIGNAGVLGKLTPIAHLDPRVWDDAFAVNVTANFRLLWSMDPLLQAAEAGRAVFLTSGAATKCQPYWGGYAVTKAALDALVKTYAAENATTRVCANLFSPGATRTRMRATAMPGEDPMTLPPAQEVAAQILPLCLPEFSGNGEIWRFSRDGLSGRADRPSNTQLSRSFLARASASIGAMSVKACIRCSTKRLNCMSSCG
jgi:NAD(P)-dependent dehydrogenase (short-subunit alcohol dehydrogenase family)